MNLGNQNSKYSWRIRDLENPQTGTQFANSVLMYKMLPHFHKMMTIMIWHFLRFDALKILTADYFVLRINKIYSKQKIWCFIHLSIFPSTFPTAVFPIHLYRVAYKWHVDRITYQQVND